MNHLVHGATGFDQNVSGSLDRAGSTACATPIGAVRRTPR
jgi:hypothetical protein